jgi:hypothetical protein
MVWPRTEQICRIVFLAQGEEGGVIAGIVNAGSVQPNGATSRIRVNCCFKSAAIAVVAGIRCRRRRSGVVFTSTSSLASHCRTGLLRVRLIVDE